MNLRARYADEIADSLWLPLAVAAQRLEMNAGALRRKCAGAWSAEGLARRQSGQWFVHAGADPRLRDRVDARTRDRQQESELAARGVTPKYIEIARRRRDLLIAFEDFSAEHRGLSARQVRAAFLARVGPEAPRITTFYIWQSAYDSDGLAGLVPRHAYRAAATPPRAGEAALDYVERLMNCGNRVSLNAALQIAAGEALKHANDPAWSISSYSAMRLAIAARRPRVLRVLADKGRRAAIAQCVPKMQRDFEAIAAGDEYCGDERHLDLWCRLLTARGWRAVRPWLTAWMDMRSRIFVGWVLSHRADSRTILGALKRAIADYGKPLRIRTDWGRDYRKASRHGEWKDDADNRVGNILAELGIQTVRVAPYTPWAKPIESAFRGLKDQMDRLYAGFWGGAPPERHEDRADYLRDNLHKLPTLDEVAAGVGKYFAAYHETPHSAVDLFGKTPLDAMSAFRDGPVRRESRLALDYLFREFVGPKLVRRDGVRHHGRWYGGDSRLIPMQGQRVLLAIQPDDQGAAWVCDAKTRAPLFEVRCLPLTGLSRDEVVEMQRDRNRALRPFAERVRAGRDFLRSTSAHHLLDARLRGLRAAQGLPQPDDALSLTIVRPALEQAIDEVAAKTAARQNAEAVRTGTDDAAIELEDLADTRSPSPAPPQAAGGDEEPDLIDMDDLVGDEND